MADAYTHKVRSLTSGDKRHKHFTFGQVHSVWGKFARNFLAFTVNFANTFYTLLFLKSENAIFFISGTSHPREYKYTFFHSNIQRADCSSLSYVTTAITYMTLLWSKPASCAALRKHTHTHMHTNTNAHGQTQKVWSTISAFRRFKKRTNCFIKDGCRTTFDPQPPRGCGSLAVFAFWSKWYVRKTAILLTGRSSPKSISESVFDWCKL
jgi:hypothetical protein